MPLTHHDHGTVRAPCRQTHDTGQGWIILIVMILLLLCGLDDVLQGIEESVRGVAATTASAQTTAAAAAAGRRGRVVAVHHREWHAQGRIPVVPSVRGTSKRARRRHAVVVVVVVGQRGVFCSRERSDSRTGSSRRVAAGTRTVLRLERLLLLLSRQRQSRGLNLLGTITTTTTTTTRRRAVESSDRRGLQLGVTVAVEIE